MSCVCMHQNLVKRDKEGYKDEFLQQRRNYLSELEIFKLKVWRHQQNAGYLLYSNNAFCKVKTTEAGSLNVEIMLCVGYDLW